MDLPGDPTRPQNDQPYDGGGDGGGGADPWGSPHGGSEPGGSPHGGSEAGGSPHSSFDAAGPPYAGSEVLGSDEPERAGSGRARRIAVVAAAAVAVAGIGGGALAVASSLSGGGTQPEDVLPAGAFAFAKIDFDPAANQKVAVYQLSRKFPDLAKLADDQDTALKDLVIGAMFQGSDSEADYERDIKPWLGDRAGFAVYPPADGAQEPTFAFAVQYTDEDAAQEAMQDTDEDVDWTTSDGYVVMTEAGGSAQRLVDEGAEDPLVDQSTYREDVDALEGSQISVVWADIAAGYAAMGDAAEEFTGEDFAAFGLDTEPTGRFALGLHADSDYLEVQGRSFDVAEGYFAGADAPSSQSGTGLVTTLPADAVAALSITGLGEGLAQAWDSILEATGDAEEVSAAAEQMGLTLPDDIQAVFGDETVVSLSGDLAAFQGETTEELPAVTVASRGADAERAGEISSMLNEGLTGAEGAIESSGDLVAFGNDPETVKQVVEGNGGLGDVEAFRTAVPDAADAGFVLYVDLARVLDEAGQAALTEEDLDRVQALSGIGFTTTGGADEAQMRLRLTVR